MYNTKIYYEDEDCIVKIEEVEGEVFVHLTLHKITKPILEFLLMVWAEIKAKLYYLGYEAVYTYTKDKRMFKLFPGAEVLPQFEYKGEKYEVGKWVLN